MNKVIKSIHKLTPMQEGMLFHRMLDEKSFNYFLQNTFWVEGKIEMDKIRIALSLVSYKHEALSAAFVIPKSSGIPRQVFIENREIECKYIETDTLDTDIFIEKIKKEDMEAGFDLQKDSLVRLQAVYFSKLNKYLLMFSNHHIIMDGWCISLIFGDLMRYYSMLMEGMTYEDIKQLVTEEKRTSSKYGEYLTWLEKQDKEAALSYWTNLLKDYEFVAEIPVINEAKPVEEQVEYGSISLSQKETDKVKEIARTCNVTINNICESIWGIILQQYNFTEDVVFGKVVSGRHVPISGIEETVGLFINTIPCRIQCSKDTTFRELFLQTKKQGISSNEYSYCSLAEIQNSSLLKADLIKCLFVFENYEAAQEGNDLLQVQMESSREQTNYDLNVVFYEQDEELSVDLLYNPSRYSKKEMAVLLERIKKALLNINNPDRKVTDLELILEEEEIKILQDFNNTKTDYNRQATLVELLEFQVEKNSNRIALAYEESKLTYSQLNEKANGLAHKLRDMGAGPDKHVMIIAERSLEVIIGMCAVLKSGAAYVPIAPSYPDERIKTIIQDCQPVAILVCEREISSVVPVIDLWDPTVFDGCLDNPVRVNSPHDLAYIMYTSGTTGVPKGVMVEQQNVVKLVKGIDYFELNEDTALLQAGQISFDASTFEIWGPLLNGGRVHLVSQETLFNSDTLKKYIIDNKINTSFLITALFNQLVHNDISIFDSLSSVVFGGEVASEKYVYTLHEHNKKIKLINGYGPTEATTFASTHQIDHIRKKVPVGKPISNTYIYILNNKRLCGIGMSGEICIAGDGLARGYLNDPSLTAERFIDNPYGEGRMYRTGDLARWLPDGNIEYISRIDDQVKVRGYRIELGEIESAILRIDHIKNCSVIVKSNSIGEKAIFAYFVADKKINYTEVREHLEKLLPEYMVPSYFMQVDAIQLSSNGKVDKRALPDIEIKTERDFIAPRTKTEEIISNIFYEILSANKVGVKDSFFELGGHSLRATRLINKIEEQLGKHLELKDVFVNDTVEKLAALVDQRPFMEYVPIPEAKKKEYYPMSSSQKRIFLLCQMDSTGVLYNMPQSMRIRGKVDPVKVEKTLQILMERHEILRTEFSLVDGELVQIINPWVKAEFEYIEDEITDENTLMKQFVRPFNLSKAPLIRICLIKRSDYWLLMIDIHHIIGDGMSMGIFVHEFSRILMGKELQPLRRQYKDYSEWMRSRDLSKQKEFWLKEFEGSIPTLDMPLDFTRQQEQSYNGATAEAQTEETLLSQVKELAQKTETTEFMVLLSALMILLSKYCRQEDIVVGSAISGRTHKDTESILGVFVNTIMLKGHLDNKKTYREFLGEIKDFTLKAYENQDYPFDELVELLDTNRDMSRNPLFDVMMILQNNEEHIFDLPDAQVEYIKHPNQIAQLDLNFIILEMERRYKIELEYCSDLYSKKSAERILKHYIWILTQISKKPQLLLGEINALTETEEDMILHEYNNTSVELCEDYTIMDLFEQQVEKNPLNTAIVYEGQNLTYREFNQKANALAHRLIEIGIKPNDFVAICSERSIEMMIGIFGILKVGAAYVPIDPEYPEERIKYILSDCKPKAILLNKYKIDTDIVTLDLQWDETYIEQYDNPKREITLDNLSYCIYTSGTTGKPKGVMNKHRGTLNLITCLQRQYPLKAGDGILQKSSFAFDFSVSEILWWCISGAKLVLLKAQGEKDTLTILETIKENKVNVITFVPSMLSVFLSSLDGHDELISMARDLKYCLSCGEALNVEVSNKFFDIFRSAGSQARLINLYGPTEASVFASFYECVPNASNVPIGKPLDNYQLYVLEGEKLCGVGIPGEICIAGYGLAAGYLNQEELTNEKFIDNPYGKGKLYRTGDLARLNDMGEMEYIGRLDEQVKVRGYRIELGEIERAIRKQEDIKGCAVICRTDKQGDKAIYAYFVSDKEIYIPSLKDSLRNLLPNYMIPSYFMQIDNIPITVNGKLDSKALPIIESKHQEIYLAPRSETEAVLCKAFSETLSVAQVGVNDNFFELGGDSLKAVRAISKIRDYGYKTNLTDIMQYQVISSIAPRLIKLKNNLGREIDTLKISEGVLGELALSESMDEEVSQLLDKAIHMLNQYSEEALSMPYKDYPLTGMGLMSYEFGIRNMLMQIPLYGDLNQELISKAWSKVEESMDVFRSSISMNTKENFVRIYDYIPKELPYIDISGSNLTEKREFMANIIKLMDCYENTQVYTTNHLAFQVLVVRFGDEEYRLIITCSHLLCDRFSVEIIKARLKEALSNQDLCFEKISYADICSLLNNMYTDVTENRIIEKLSLNEYDKGLKNFLQMNKGRVLRNMRFHYKSESFKLLSDERQYEISQQAFLKAIKFTYYYTDIPVLLLHMARKNKHKDLFHHVGEFLDLTPILIRKDYDGMIDTLAKESLLFKRDQNLYFASVLMGSESDRYPEIRQLFQTYMKDMDKILIVNHTGVIKNGDNLIETGLDENFTNIIDISLFDDGFLMNVPVEDGRQTEMEKLLTAYLEQGE